MRAEQRRTEIERLLAGARQPVSATTLAERFAVSRQVIVGDIALLRAAGAPISATPRGYVRDMPNPSAEPAADGYTGTVACRHQPDQMEDELNLIVEAGGMIVDVIVDHPLYGQLTGMLQIRSHVDVRDFVSRMAEQNAGSLSEITGGVHLHTIRCADRAAFERICAALDTAGFLLRR